MEFELDLYRRAGVQAAEVKVSGTEEFGDSWSILQEIPHKRERWRPIVGSYTQGWSEFQGSVSPMGRL